MSKKPGDGFYPAIDRYYCPHCGKKGCYKKSVVDIPESYKCYYCRKWSYTDDIVKYAEQNNKICPLCNWTLDNDVLYKYHGPFCPTQKH